MARQKHHPGALVPEYLTSLTIEKIPVDTPYYVNPGDPTDDNSTSALFVTDDKQLRMSRSEIIDPESDYTGTPIGMVGIMKTLVTDEQLGLREVYIADLRFIDNNAILDIGVRTLLVTILNYLWTGLIW